MSRSFKVIPATSAFRQVSFPTDDLLAIYARQSRAEQIENNPESFEQQTQGLYKTALELGWLPELIQTLVENQQVNGNWKNASGAKSMLERPVLQELIGMIARDEVKAVLVWLVDRLFRDEDRTDAGVFARICREHQCLVLTSEGDTFDFTNRRDYDRFIDEARVGGDFITHYLKGRALPARKQVALRGEYDGRVVPVGFTVERKTKGVIRKYQIYEPHAEIVRWIFKRYKELGGNLVALRHEIGVLPYVFPFYPAGVFVTNMRLGRNDYGYIISDRGLKDLLCNIAYIGWWYVKGAPLRKDNHPAIVDEADFWFAFDRLSPVTLENEPIEREQSRERYNKVGTIPCNALLKDILQSNEGKVYVSQVATGDRKAAYTIIQNTAYYGGDKRGSIYVKELDTLFTEHLLERLEKGKEVREVFTMPSDFTPEQQERWHELDWLSPGSDENYVMVDMLVEIAKAQQENTAGIVAQLAEYREEAANLEHTLHYGSKGLDAKTIEKFAARLGNLHRSIEQLEAKQKRAAQQFAEAREFITRLDDVPAVWHEMGIEKQRRFLKLVCDTIVLTKPASNWLQLEINWNFQDVPSSICYIWQRKAGDRWTEEENESLRQMYRSADRLDILKALPTRNWTAIRAQAYRLKIKREPQANTSGLHEYLSVEDHAFMQRVGIPFDSEYPKTHVWWVVIQKVEGSLQTRSFR